MDGSGHSAVLVLSLFVRSRTGLCHYEVLPPPGFWAGLPPQEMSTQGRWAAKRYYSTVAERSGMALQRTDVSTNRQTASGKEKQPKQKK